MRMPFGKHRDREIQDLPDGYLCWLYDEVEIASPYLKQAIANEYRARFEGDSSDQRQYQQQQQQRAQGHEQQQDWSGLDGITARYGTELMLELMEAGYRTLALRRHPDRGGSAEDMHEINELIAQARKILGGK